MRLTTLAFAAACLTLCLPAFSEDYIIKFSRPMAAGDQYAFHGTWHDEHTTQVPGNPPRSVKRFIEVDADMTVIDPSKVGLPLHDTFTIRKCTATVDGKPLDCPPAGTIIELKRDGAAQDFTARDTTLDPQFQKLLEQVLPNTREADIDYDPCFGAKDAKRAGDVWPVNKDELAKAFAALGAPVDSSNIKGTVLLSEVHDDNNQKILRIVGRYSVSGIPASLPPGAKLISASADTVDTMELPADVSRPVLSDGEVIHNITQASVRSLSGPVIAKDVGLTTTLREFKPVVATQPAK